MKQLIRLKFHASLMIAVLATATSALAQTNDLDQTLSKLGYKITSQISSAGADWELRDFQMRTKKIISIKSRKKVPGEKNMYYRYAIRIEDFGSEADAQKRMDHIAATPPGPDSKMVGPENSLREGFLRGKRVYVVGTVVYMFVVDGSLNRFRLQLEEKIPAE